MRANNTHSDPTVNAIKKDFKIILGFFFFLFLLVIGWYLYTPPYHPPHTYPQLSDADRQRLDLQLFNELSVNGSRPPHYTVERRQQLILNMAKQGLEVADLAYKLMNVKYGMSGRHYMMPDERSAYHHLQDLAEKGDASAQCLAAMVVVRWGLDMREYERYVVQAANAGQPYCTNILSGLLDVTILLETSKIRRAPYWQTIPKDDAKSKEYKLRAAKKGVEQAQLFLMDSYSQGIRGYPLDIGKAKCWLTLAEQANTGEALAENSTLNRQIRQAREKNINVLEQYNPKDWCDSKLTY